MCKNHSQITNTRHFMSTPLKTEAPPPAVVQVPPAPRHPCTPSPTVICALGGRVSQHRVSSFIVLASCPPQREPGLTPVPSWLPGRGLSFSPLKMKVLDSSPPESLPSPFPHSPARFCASSDTSFLLFSASHPNLSPSVGFLPPSWGPLNSTRVQK